MSATFTEPTPLTLLERLRRPDDPAAWGRFVDLYAPVILAWVRRLGVPAGDRADVVQDVFVKLAAALPAFHYSPSLRFRGWLFRVVKSAAVDFRRKTGRRVDTQTAGPPPDDLPGGPDPAAEWVEAEYRRHLYARVVDVMKAEFEPATWRAFWAYAVESTPPAEVAAALGVSVDTVYQAKTRVLRRLRRELDGMLD